MEMGREREWERERKRERERTREREREREKKPYFFLEVEDGVRDGALRQVLAHKWRNKENIILKINKSLGLMHVR